MILKKRYLGIELLRIIAALMVVMLHSLGHGGLLKQLEPGTRKYCAVWLLEIISYSAVDIFVIISGFLGYSDKKKKFNYKNLFFLWLQTVYYGVSIAIVYDIVQNKSISLVSVIHYLFPIMNNTYWFFTSYAGVYFVKPILDTGVMNLEKKTYKNILLIIFIWFSVIQTISDPFKMNRGYSFAWFIILYCIGAGIKKLDLQEKYSTKRYIVIIISLVLITWGWKIYGKPISLLDMKINQNFFVSYTSPTITTIAVCYVILFSRIRSFNDIFNKIIGFFSPGTFAVYLINDHYLTRNNFISNRFTNIAADHIVICLSKVLCFSVCFVVFSLIVDKIRQYLFSKIKQLTEG